MTFELSEEDSATLAFALGYAAGAAGRTDQLLMWAFIKLSNAINANNPNYRPYEIPEEFQ